jgi:N-acetylglucosamine kinase-like BadF-type ATPase
LILSFYLSKSVDRLISKFDIAVINILQLGVAEFANILQVLNEFDEVIFLEGKLSKFDEFVLENVS